MSNARRWPRAPARPFGGAGWAQTAVQVQKPGLPPGTVGALLRRSGTTGEILAVTAGHVLGVDARPGDAVELQPFDDAPVAGVLQDWVPVLRPDRPRTPVDAALVRVSATAIDALRRQPELCPRGTAEPMRDEPVILHTRSGPLTGRLRGRIDAPLRLQLKPLMSYVLVDALCWQPDSGQSQPGDSGAPLWNARGQLIGLHAGLAPAGAAGTAVATPIAAVLGWAGGALMTADDDPGTLPLATALPAPPAAPLPGDAEAIDTLARTMWGEAQGEGDTGLAAVAHVVLNRVDAARWWGRDVVGVCRKPWQFSCWNSNDPVNPRVRAVTAADAIFARALEVAGQLLRLQRETHDERVRLDPTGGATHYHSSRIPPPRWARGHPTCARIRNHLFYREVA